MKLRKKTKNENDSLLKLKELFRNLYSSLEQSYLVIKREKRKYLKDLYNQLEFENQLLQENDPNSIS